MGKWRAIVALGIVLGVVSGCAIQTVVSKAEYDQIQEGMSYQQVVDIVGSEGEEMSSSKMQGVPGYVPEITTKMYVWKNPDGTNMICMFQNDRLITKSQTGLE